MNPLQHIDHSGGGAMMPLLIFIIWLAISIVSGSKAKKKKQRDFMERQRRTSSAPAPEPAVSRKREPDLDGSDEEKQPGAMDEIRRELETILTGGRPKRAEPLPEAKKEFARQPDTAKTPSHEAVSLEVKPSQEWKFADAKIYSIAAADEPSIADSAITDEKPGGTERSAVAVSFDSIDEARKGFVWAEIYGKPKALRVDE